MTTVKLLPDIAAEKLCKPRPLIVGVKDVPVMRKWKDRDVMTRQSAYVRLGDRRGIHASRLAGVLMRYEGLDLNQESVRALVQELEQTHETPVTYMCKWECMEQGYVVKRKIEVSGDLYMTVELGYVSTCPCAAEMCRAVGQGIPHQQRSVMKVTTVWDKDVMEVLTRLFLMPRTVMKREEELEWCVQASKSVNQVFAEDAARRIGQALEVAGVWEYLVEVEHFESLHMHSMVAVNRRGRFV